LSVMSDPGPPRRRPDDHVLLPGENEDPGRLKVFISRYEAGRSEEVRDVVAAERPLRVTLSGREVASVTCSPVDVEDLATGLLFWMGLPRDLCGGLSFDWDALAGVVDVPCGDAAPLLRLPSFVGRVSEDNAPERISSVRGGPVLSPSDVSRLGALLEEASTTFRLTGGTHCSAVALDGELAIVREDVRRANSVDKAIGGALRRALPLESGVLLCSGRVSYDLVLRAALAGMPVIIARSAPTSMAVEEADRLGVTLVAFARGDRFNVYSHPERVRGDV